jgi:hypothetical protein
LFNLPQTALHDPQVAEQDGLGKGIVQSPGKREPYPVVLLSLLRRATAPVEIAEAVVTLPLVHQVILLNRHRQGLNKPIATLVYTPGAPGQDAKMA